MKLFDKPILFIVFVALSFFTLNETFRYLVGFEKSQKESYEKDKLILNNLISAQSKNIQILAEILSIDPYVIEGYEKNDPEIIKKQVAPIWKKVREEKLTYEIHFFKPPAISFVNFSNFKSIGHDVSSVRTDIEWITSSFKSSSHALMCKTYAGFRATHPILDKNGKILGGLSLGKKIDWIPEAIKEKTKHDSFLVYEKDSTKSLKKKYFENFMKNKVLFGKHILADKTVDVSVEDLKDIDFSKDIQEITIGSKEFTLYSYPIIDFNKKVMGYVCTLTELKEFKDKFSAQLFRSFIIIILTALVLIYITRKKISYLLEQISYIKDITNNIKKRNFKFLNRVNDESEVISESLVELQHNIVVMGHELERQYQELEAENMDKDKQLIEQLYRDELTGLLNTNALFRDLDNNKECFVAIFNIRDFKYINDAFGFEAGNYILRELAVNNAPLVSEYGYRAYRVGSDEFVIMNDKTVTRSEFKKFVLGILDKVEHTEIKLDDSNTNISVNFYAGICLDNDKRLEKADMALSQAKRAKKEYVVYSEDENTIDMHINNIEIINKVANAIKNDDITLFYQPIVDKDSNILKYESLVRMVDDNKIISPFFFLEISKRTKHYNSITKIVIEKSFEKFRDIDSAFSINISAEDILNEDVVDMVKSKLSTCRNPQRVVFELIESDDLYNVDEVEIFIDMIRTMGAKIAIDDFGTGYSNFSYIMKIKPDYLKIDGSLIKNIDSDENAIKIVRTIVNFANELKIKTIAEYVHSKDIFDICIDLGIDEFQGFYFGEPKSEL